jgi:hypothetical protein
MTKASFKGYKDYTADLLQALGAAASTAHLQDAHHPLQKLYQALCQYPPQAVQDIQASIVALVINQSPPMPGGHYTAAENAILSDLQSECLELKSVIGQQGCTEESVGMLVRFVDVHKQQLVNLSPAYHVQERLAQNTQHPAAQNSVFEKEAMILYQQMDAMMQDQTNICVIAGERHDHPACLIAEHLLLEAAKKHGIQTLVAEASSGEFGAFYEALSVANGQTPLYCTLPPRDHEEFIKHTRDTNTQYFRGHAKQCEIAVIAGDMPALEKRKITDVLLRGGHKERAEIQQELNELIQLQAQFKTMSSADPGWQKLNEEIAKRTLLLSATSSALKTSFTDAEQAALNRNDYFIDSLSKNTPCIGILGSLHLHGIIQRHQEWQPLYLQVTPEIVSGSANTQIEHNFLTNLPAANRIVLPEAWNDLRPEDIHRVVENARIRIQQQHQQGQPQFVESPQSSMLSLDVQEAAIAAVQPICELTSKQERVSAPHVDQAAIAATTPKKTSRCVVM